MCNQICGVISEKHEILFFSDKLTLKWVSKVMFPITKIDCQCSDKADLERDFTSISPYLKNLF